MVMGVLWTRLTERGKDWRYVYKVRVFLIFPCNVWKFTVYDLVFFFFFFQALAVIDYLISNGSERAVDEIIEHTYQISVSISLLHIDRPFCFFFTDIIFVCDLSSM